VLLEIKVQPGETVAVNSVVAVIGAESESAAEAVPPEKESEPGVEAAPSVQTAPSSEPEAPAATPPASTASLEERRRTKSSPLVRKIAAEHQIDLTSVRGTGAGGRVTKQDIMGVVELAAQWRRQRR
jgi:2-oxoglutarate dehydrogenase E2 component (dihydrolipoamide succinyltransferase)